MAPITRSQIRKVIKSKTQKKLANDSTDLLIGLNFQLFLKDFAKRAEEISDKTGSSEVQPYHFKQAAEETLKRYRG
ncbi:hypothetical protein WICMUC_003372 [Wickerhamomyces mucosus]|uniref:Transcription factor CBF/NF-Y/archaeal histone domain-containing protein n=1 Tax=Wickerhamomyces mucosus TaxID=1378264 RepID=A0A9P8TDJ0_9ASCO|nr:hypothetical protein WICMUC_003372 [Wickerhamomyces mucosus]